jgi:ceramide glucosyltransferase
LRTAEHFILGIAAIPAIYYLLVLYSTARFFLGKKERKPADLDFTPPISNLKPVRGLDPGAYENFASFCRQDYPEYEILFCVDRDDPAAQVIEKLKNDFPGRAIRVLYGSGRDAANDKVARLARLTEEARYEHLVISDSDVRVEADYLREVIAPLANADVGAATCLYVPCEEGTYVQRLQNIGMLSDFYPGILVARELDGVKFALGPTIATTRTRLMGFGGYASIENRPADDLLVGKLIAEQGYKVELLPYTISTVPDYQSLRELFDKRLRWITVMRHMRPWGHLGLIFTFGLPWAILACAVRPTGMTALAYFGGYMVLRVAIAVLVGSWGLNQRNVWSETLLIPIWDAIASLIWLASFTRKTIRWRGHRYVVQGGQIAPAQVRARTPQGVIDEDFSVN